MDFQNIIERFDELLDEKSNTNPKRTYREAVLALKAAHR